MKKTLILLLVLAFEIWFILSRNHSVESGYIIRGCAYSECLPKITNDYRFLFRMSIDRSVYKAFVHNDIDNALLFKDEVLVYIGPRPAVDTELGLFKSTVDNQIYKVNFHSCTNPIVYANTLIGHANHSRERLLICGEAVESCANRKIDYGLTCAVLIARALSIIVPNGNRKKSLTERLGFDYGAIRIGASRMMAENILGNPVYIDKSSGVEYYGVYEFINGENQILGVVFANDTVSGVFSSRLLDQRITCKCCHEVYLGPCIKE